MEEEPQQQKEIDALKRQRTINDQQQAQKLQSMEGKQAQLEKLVKQLLEKK